jgi:hypothetical protein
MILLKPHATNFPITQHFGEHPDWYPKTNGHNGIDYGVPEGTQIRAAAGGVVQRAELDTQTASTSGSGYGNNVRILHPDGSLTIYGHFLDDSFLVKTGQGVKMGDPIGLSGGLTGHTGFSTGPHLHFELRTGIALVNAIDPEPFIVEKAPPKTGLCLATITPEANGLRVRNGPGVEHAIIRYLKAGDQVLVYGFAGEDVWLRIEDGYIKYLPEWENIEPK